MGKTKKSSNRSIDELIKLFGGVKRKTVLVAIKNGELDQNEDGKIYLPTYRDWIRAKAEAGEIHVPQYWCDTCMKMHPSYEFPVDDEGTEQLQTRECLSCARLRQAEAQREAEIEERIAEFVSEMKEDFNIEVKIEIVKNESYE